MCPEALCTKGRPSGILLHPQPRLVLPQEAGAAHMALPALSTRLHDALEEHGVILHVGMLGRLQLAEREEEWAAAGHIGFTLGPLEGCRAQVGPEGIDGVLTVVLVQQHEGDLQGKGRRRSGPEQCTELCVCHLCSLLTLSSGWLGVKETMSGPRLVVL